MNLRPSAPQKAAGLKNLLRNLLIFSNLRLPLQNLTVPKRANVDAIVPYRKSIAVERFQQAVKKGQERKVHKSPLVNQAAVNEE